MLPLLTACLLIAAPGARAACPEPASRASVILPVAESLERFAAMDGAGFLVARDRAMVFLPCLHEPLAPADAARVHGMMALDAFLRHDDASAVNAFRAALAADPGWALPVDFVPDGHPVRLQLQVATSLKGTITRPIPDLSPETVLADGVKSSTAPSDRPVILQRAGVDGRVVESVYVPANGPLPDWSPVRPVSALLPAAPKKRPVALAGASGGALLVAGTCYGLAWFTHDNFMHPDTSSGYPSDPESLRTRANAWTWASIGAGGLALALGTATVIRW